MGEDTKVVVLEQHYLGAVHEHLGIVFLAAKDASGQSLRWGSGLNYQPTREHFERVEALVLEICRELNPGADVRTDEPIDVFFDNPPKDPFKREAA